MVGDHAEQEAEWPRSLVDGLRTLGLEASANRVERHQAYLGLLAKWNRVYNLTAVRDPGDMVVRHILDSLTVAPFVRGAALADVGSGAGLPGIPLAIQSPERSVTLLEASGKKARFLRQVVIELGLGNVRVVEGRVEEYPGNREFDTVVSRAFAATPAFVRLAGRMCAEGGRILAMQGGAGEMRLGAPVGSFVVTACDAVSVPGLSAQRHIVSLGRAS